jgi:hypothetical protein
MDLEMPKIKNPPQYYWEGPSCKKFYKLLNYFALAVVSIAAAAVSTVAAAAVSTVATAVSVFASVEAPPQAASAAIAKIAITFFIFWFF